MPVTAYTGIIEKILFSSDSFTVAILRTGKTTKVKFVAKLSGIKEGDNVTISGSWKGHSKYGDQFTTTSVVRNIGTTKEGMIAYLSSQQRFTGIGEARARILVEKYGDNLEQALIEEPNEAAKAIRANVSIIENLRKEWDQEKEVMEVEKQLYGFGLTQYQVGRLVSFYGKGAADVVKTTPYQMINDIKGFGFKTVDQIAIGSGTPKNSHKRYEAATLYAIQMETEKGHTYSTMSEIEKNASKLLSDKAYDANPYLDYLIHTGDIVCEHGVYSTKKLHAMESYVYDVLLKSYKNSCSDESLMMSYHMIKNQEPFTLLNEEQNEALENALTRRVSIISGEAGTGKSFTINAIYRVYMESEKRTFMAAPTGKAARRLEDMTGTISHTIHMLLGYNGNEWKYGSHNKIIADLIIIDEFSMVDVELAWRLFSAIDFGLTSLVIVGDHNQLPSIGPGNILRDLCNYKLVPKVILKNVIRQAGVLKLNSIKILEGKAEETSGYTEDGFPWYLNKSLGEPDEIIEHIEKLYNEVLHEKLSFDPLRDVQILIPMKSGPIGTETVNLRIRKLLQKKLWNVNITDEENLRNRYFLHDKIIQTRNNYDIGIMNGSIGYIEEINDDGDLLVDFDGDMITLRKSVGNISDIKLAYALTIHKSQGSEFPCVILIVYKGHFILHDRNTIYTGVTRASKTCMLLGDSKSIEIALSKKDMENRRTMLSLWLEEAKGNGVIEL